MEVLHCVIIIVVYLAARYSNFRKKHWMGIFKDASTFIPEYSVKALNTALTWEFLMIVLHSVNILHIIVLAVKLYIIYF